MTRQPREATGSTSRNVLPVTRGAKPGGLDCGSRAQDAQAQPVPARRRWRILANARIGANVPVSDLEQAIAFYEGKLGLKLFERGDEQPYARFSGAGETKLGVYESGTAGQSRHTLASFVVDDVVAAVRELRANGVVFEEYDMPGIKTVDGVATMGDTRTAWLKDPDGNILEIAGG